MSKPVIDWEGIVIHHSATDDDGQKNDWSGIRKYHMSWRHSGIAISESYARELVGKGDKTVLRPCADIGYHFGIEVENGILEVKTGRSLSQYGAHCIGMNSMAIGICFVGDYDRHEPAMERYYMGALLCKNLMKQFPKITLDSIKPHRDFANKTCPGNKFNMPRFLKSISEIKSSV